MKLLVALGNPGPKYELTRHNAGFLVLDALVDKAGAQWQKKGDALVARGRLEGQDCLFLKPQTYMNLSGKAVAPVVSFYKITPGDMVVLHDEIDVAFGKVKARVGGGAGGHNGIRSIHQETGMRDFHRLKLGVGRPGADYKGDVSSWVLAPMSDSELEQLDKEMVGETIIRLQNIFKAG